MSRHRLIRGKKPRPVGSVPCERSFSALRKLKTWNRTTMTEDRLNGLALFHIHKNVNIDRERVLDAFNASGNLTLLTFNL